MQWIDSLRLAASAVLALTNTTVTTNRAGAASTATYTLESDGDIMRSNGSGLSMTDGGDWITPKSAAGAAYECYATVTSGALSTGTAGSWLALGSNRSWTRGSGGPPGIQVCVFTLEVREVANTANSVTATITLDANSEV